MAKIKRIIKMTKQFAGYFCHFRRFCHFCSIFYCISFHPEPSVFPFSGFRRNQNSKYRPNISRVCASMAGRLWNNTAEMGTKNHCKYMEMLLHGPYFLAVAAGGLNLHKR